MPRNPIAACPKVLLVPPLVILLSGCWFGMYLPSSTDVVLEHADPLLAPATEVHTLAIALPSTVETLTGVSDPSRGKLDPVAVELAERLPRSGRIALVPMAAFHAALKKAAPPDFRAGSAMTEAQWKEFLRSGARAVNAEGVILLHGNWDSPINLGKMSFGRGEYKRRLGMSVIAVQTGETVWFQEATVSVSEGITLPPEEEIREPVVARLVQNLLGTLH